MAKLWGSRVIGKFLYVAKRLREKENVKAVLSRCVTLINNLGCRKSC